MNYNINKLREALKKHADYLQTGDASKHADLSGSDLSGANLSGANLSGACLNGARLPKYYYLPVDDNG